MWHVGHAGMLIAEAKILNFTGLKFAFVATGANAR